MIKIENTDVYGWEAAIRGMRNPMNSWEKSDSQYCRGACSVCNTCYKKPDDDYAPFYCATSSIGKTYVIGPNDHSLMKSLAKAGSDHSKFMRMINVTMDITAPLYWWKEFDTYKVGTVANSCSTMHKIAEKEFTLEDFSHEHLLSGWPGKDKNDIKIILPGPAECMENTIIMLNRARDSYLEACKKGLSAKDIWWQMIQLLPSSYNQRRTIQLNYQVLKSMYFARRNHKLDEWREFCAWCETLPYFKEICIQEGDAND